MPMSPAAVTAVPGPAHRNAVHRLTILLASLRPQPAHTRRVRQQWGDNRGSHVRGGAGPCPPRTLRPPHRAGLPRSRDAARLHSRPSRKQRAPWTGARGDINRREPRSQTQSAPACDPQPAGSEEASWQRLANNGKPESKTQEHSQQQPKARNRRAA